jgi:hypothetical protein
MIRPNVSAMDEIESVLRDIQDMELAIQELVERLHELPGEMVEQIPVDERINAARYLYWLVPEVSSRTIANAFFGVKVQKLPKLIGGYEGDIHCEKCGEPIQFTSRSRSKAVAQMARTEHPIYAEGYKVLCEACKEIVLAERRRFDEQESGARQKRLQELRTMPYREYLQTPEWQARRRQHLESVGYRCQICNASGLTLDVHHRTYERRGQEYYKDLITLCRDCHSIFHKSHKLAG